MACVCVEKSSYALLPPEMKRAVSDSDVEGVTMCLSLCVCVCNSGVGGFRFVSLTA